MTGRTRSQHTWQVTATRPEAQCFVCGYRNSGEQVSEFASVEPANRLNVAIFGHGTQISVYVAVVSDVSVGMQ